MILSLLAVLALSSGASAVPVPSPDISYDPAPAKVIQAAKDSRVEEVVASVIDGFHLHLSVQWRTCGQENALYFPGEDFILLCYELLQNGAGYTRFTAAHELGHALIDQWEIPYTGSQESAADEFAVAVSIVMGNGGDPDAAAERYERWAKEPDAEPPPRDEHAPFAHRAGQIWREAHTDQANVIDRWARLTSVPWPTMPHLVVSP